MASRFPQADQCEQAAGHHPSSLTDPDDAERDTGTYVKRLGSSPSKRDPGYKDARIREDVPSGRGQRPGSLKVP